MDDRYLYIFLHIPKTAGTTIRYHLEKNLNPDEIISVYNEKEQFVSGHDVDEYCMSLSENQRSRVKVIFGHDLYYGIHKHFAKEPRYVTFLRHPVDRTISHYKYLRNIFDIGGTSVSDGIGPEKTIDKWCSENTFTHDFHVKFLTQRFLDRASGDGPVTDSDLERALKVLDDFYFIGITENFDEDAPYLYHELGVHTFFGRKNVSKTYQISTDISRSRDYINGLNTRDMDLYEYAKKRSADFKERHSDFKRIVRDMVHEANVGKKVSVIIPNYNYETYIRETIDSAIAQTYKNWEIIIVDDGSTDNSVNIIKEYAERYPGKIRVFTHPGGGNRGIVQTYKYALSLADGDYVAFLEADDIWDEKCLESKVAVLNKHKDVLLVYSDVHMFGDQEKRITRIKKNLHVLVGKPDKNKPFFTCDMLKSNVVPTFSAAMVRREVFMELDFNIPIEHEMSLDWWLWAQISMLGKFYYIPQKYTLWRIHKDSYSCRYRESLEEPKEECQKFMNYLAVFLPQYVKKHRGNELASLLLKTVIKKQNILTFRGKQIKELMARLNRIENTLIWRFCTRFMKNDPGNTRGIQQICRMDHKTRK